MSGDFEGCTKKGCLPAGKQPLYDALKNMLFLVEYIPGYKYTCAVSFAGIAFNTA
jgi:hypothetical protein